MSGWIAAVLTGGYLIGCMHGSVLARLLSGVNLKTEGVKNSGASNAAIVLGWKYGMLVAAVDIAKGAAAVLVIRHLAAETGFGAETVWLLLFLTGAAVVAGHNFPFYMNFDGGKGTASVIGIMLGLDWRLGLAGGLLLIAVALLTDYLITGVLMLYLVLFLLSVWPAEGFWPVATAAALFVLAVFKHIENIVRIRNGTEKKVSAVFRKQPSNSV